MAYNTDNLNLFCYDTIFDIDEIFSVEQALNDNWVILDNAYGNLTNLIPTKTSQLTNDSGFLTQHQSLANYVKKTDANTVSGATTFTGTTKVPASTTAGTALQLTAQSKATNGYIKFGSGIIIQWGTTSQRSSDSTQTVTLPTSFSNKNYQVANSNVTTNTNNQESGTIYDKTSTSFKTFAWGGRATSWIAVGY